MLYPDFIFFRALKSLGNACRSRGYGLFSAVWKSRGAISDAEKIWISGCFGCIFALRSQAALQHSFWEQTLIALHSVCTDIASRSQAAPQHSFWKRVFIALHSVCTDIAPTYKAGLYQTDWWKNKFSGLIHASFFDIVLQQKVRQVGLSETPTHRVGLYLTLFWQHRLKCRGWGVEAWGYMWQSHTRQPDVREKRRQALASDFCLALLASVALM